jgi:hypothetical protein
LRARFFHRGQRREEARRVVDQHQLAFRQHGPQTVDRTVLPITEPQYPPITELDARKATPPPRFEVKRPTARPTCSSS